MKNLSVIMIGDVSGDSGLETLERRLPPLIKKHSAVFTVVNGENSAGGFGMTKATLDRIINAGADVVTSGNHVWEKREFWPFLEDELKILRPANYPPDTVGRGWGKYKKEIDGKIFSFLAINLQGREFLSPIDCPFRTFDSIEKEKDDIILVDFHAESGREKEALGFYLNGRAAVIAGTHTHVQTADEKILSEGSAYISDLGMTGVKGAVIGMDPKICIDRVRKQVLYRMETPARSENEKRALQGIAVAIDTETGKAISVMRIDEDDL